MLKEHYLVSFVHCEIIKRKNIDDISVVIILNIIDLGIFIANNAYTLAYTAGVVSSRYLEVHTAVK